MKNSFILFKPDSMENQEIRTYVYTYILNNGLTIIESKTVYLTEKDVELIWDFTSRDLVSKCILSDYLTNRTLDLIRVAGEEAISIVSRLKNDVREKYSRSFYENCIHAPKNEAEYMRDMAVFEGRQLPKMQQSPLIYDTSRFQKYFKLSYTEKILEARKLYAVTKGINLVKTLFEKTKKYCLTLHNDDVHELVYVAAAIYEYVPGITLCDAYLKCVIVEVNSVACLYESDEIHLLNRMHDQLTTAGLKVDVQ